MDKVKVRVPASSANLGPGFDSIGVALAMYDTVTFQRRRWGLKIDGCPSRYRNFRNITVMSFNKTMSYIGRSNSGLYMRLETDIPSARGLGSSAALIAAGAIAANHFCGDPLSREELLKICTEIEGHPDNLAPALFGNLTASFMEGKEPFTAHYSVNPCWKFTAIIPQFRLSTFKARAALPEKIDFKDAVFNISRASVLLKAFEGENEALLQYALGDKLHQPYRSALIEDYHKIEQLAYSLGAVGFYLSGAGPTLMCISKDDDFSDKISWKIARGFGGKWSVKALEIDRQGAKIIY